MNADPRPASEPLPAVSIWPSATGANACQPASSMSGCGRCGRAQCAGCYIGGPNHPWSERVLDTDGYLADLVKRDEERQQEAAENAASERSS